MAYSAHRPGAFETTTVCPLPQIKFPEEYTHIEDNSLRQNDLYPKMNWPVTQNLGYSLNFG